MAPSAQTATRPLFAACSDEARVFADEARTRTPDYRPSATPASSRASSSSPTRCDSGNGAKGCRTMSLAMTPPSRILSGLPVLFARGRPSEGWPAQRPHLAGWDNRRSARLVLHLSISPVSPFRGGIRSRALRPPEAFRDCGHVLGGLRRSIGTGDPEKHWREACIVRAGIAAHCIAR